MSNMSYCRFQNTNSDFADCVGALDEMDFGETGPLSRDETRAACELIAQALDLVLGVAETCGKEVEDLEDEDIESFLANLNENAERDGEL